jgi:NAD(P)H dehydrogenase (quinone)
MLGVTGATGEVGGRVARRLAERGLEQRLIVRDPARAPELAGAHVVQASGYHDREQMTRALRGVTTLFLVSAGEAEDRVSIHAAAVDAAVDAGVTHLVYLSFLAAAPDATFTFARDHFHTEEHVRASGLPHTFLRQSLYLDFLPGMVGADGVIRGPGGDGRVAAVARDDVADVAAAVLATPTDHTGLTYDVTGRERLSFAEIARALGATYTDETLDEARASRAGQAPAYAVEGWVTSYAAVAAGELDVVADTVPRLTGHPAQSLAELIR